VALLVQNNAGAIYDQKMGSLKDLVISNLASEKLTIIDPETTLAPARVYAKGDLPLVKFERDTLRQVKEFKDEAMADAPLRSASPARIAELTKAQYILYVNLSSVSSERKEFQGQGTFYKTNSMAHDTIARLTLRCILASTGAVKFADTVVVTRRDAAVAPSSYGTDLLLNEDLLLQAAKKIGEIVNSKFATVSALPAAVPVRAVSVQVNSNVKGATIDVDGVTIGSTDGTIQVTPGIHVMRVSRERYATWEKTVNFSPDQKLFVQLELSAEGIARDNVEKELATRRKVKELHAEGSKNFLDKSSVNIDKAVILDLDISPNE